MTTRFAWTMTTLCTTLIVTPGVATNPIAGFVAEDWVLDLGFGSSASLTPTTMVIHGPDGGAADDTSYTHLPTIQDAIISFDWDWFVPNSSNPGFDSGYYIINDVHYKLSAGIIAGGTISDALIPAGSTYGFGVDTTDGLFGGGILTITNFVYKPIPVPGVTALLAIGGLSLSPRRRRVESLSRPPP